MTPLVRRTSRRPTVSVASSRTPPVERPRRLRVPGQPRGDPGEPWELSMSSGVAESGQPGPAQPLLDDLACAGADTMGSEHVVHIRENVVQRRAPKFRTIAADHGLSRGHSSAHTSGRRLRGPSW
jgi:hypothetical protein